MAFDYDVVVIGSGFGGSVAALRLSEQGERVAVLEQGRRFADADLERAGTDATALAWLPSAGLTGPFAQDVFRHVAIVRGVGVGGGSLVYAAVLLEPRTAFFRDPRWAFVSSDFAAELAPHYARARAMLGVTDNPHFGLQDEWLKRAAIRLGGAALRTFGQVPQGILFDKPGTTQPDPFFGGRGPSRTGCVQCGRCITGCAYGAKNSLDKNYLHLAEGLGAQILAERKVTHVEALPEGGYRVHMVHPFRRGVRHPALRARRVVLAAGVLGTLEILFASRDVYRTLPRVSAKLGAHVRTNSEAIVGVLANDARVDVTHGATISTHFFPDDHTHVTQNRFPASYGFMRMYMAPMVDDEEPRRRARRVFATLVHSPRAATRSLFARNWTRRMSVLTVMQHVDNELSFSYGRTPLKAFRRGLVSRVAPDQAIPSYIPEANRAARAFAEVSDGLPLNMVMESVGNLSVTAHILGGAVMGASPAHGVIDGDHEVYGHPGLYVVDGSALPVNVGVNPSLTITALAERFALRFGARSQA